MVSSQALFYMVLMVLLAHGVGADGNLTGSASHTMVPKQPITHAPAFLHPPQKGDPLLGQPYSNTETTSPQPSLESQELNKTL